MQTKLFVTQTIDGAYKLSCGSDYPEIILADFRGLEEAELFMDHVKARVSVYFAKPVDFDDTVKDQLKDWLNDSTGNH